MGAQPHWPKIKKKRKKPGPKPKRVRKSLWGQNPARHMMPKDAANPALPVPVEPIKAGRRSVYHPDMVVLVKRLINEGLLTEIQICHLLGITRQTMWEWKQKHPEFAEALLVTPEKAIQLVENSMYNMATGIAIPCVKIFSPAKGHKKPQIVEYTEYLPPNVEAGKFILYNRDPTRWKRDIAPPADAPPAHAQAAEAERRAKFNDVMALLEERARCGEAPIFAEPLKQINQGTKPLAQYEKDSPLTTGANPNGKANGHAAPNGKGNGKA